MLQKNPGTPTTSTVTETEGVVDFELHVRGQARPVWIDRLKQGASYSIRGEANDQSVREKMFEDLLTALSELHLPYFIPSEQDQIGLPLVVDLTGGY